MPASPKTLPISAGDVVVVRWGPEPLVGQVLEDRGKLGPGHQKVFRVGWIPSLSEEILEIEVSGEGISLVIPRSEWIRALARIDEFSSRTSGASGTSRPATSQLAESFSLLNQAVAAALDRGRSKDFELVHRRCVEDFGPAVLRKRRSLSESNSALMMPTLSRLAAMVEGEADLDRQWLVADQQLKTWQSLVYTWFDTLGDPSAADDDRHGQRLLSIVGYCADMAAWIRYVKGVGD